MPGGSPGAIKSSRMVRSVPPLAGGRRRNGWTRTVRGAIFGSALLSLAGCSESAPSPGDRSEAPAAAAPPAPFADDPADSRPRLIAFGDSLTAGYGIEVSEAWPARLQELLDEGGFAYRVVNAGVSGETTSGGLRRLPWVLDREPDARLVVIALGGNDGLRGMPARLMEENLRGMIAEAEGRGLTVLLAGVPAPPELGRDYEVEFETAFREVAGGAGVALLPSLLEGVAGVPERNQRDGIHPNPQGAQRLAGNVLAALRPLLTEPAGSRGVSAPE